MKKLISKTESPKTSSHALAGKNIRFELAISFPNTKFSVTSESFSMGNAVNIFWMNGPTKSAVKAITDKYEFGTFDGMTDSSGIKATFCGGLYGESKFINNSREISADEKAKIISHWEELRGEKYNDNENSHYTDINEILSNKSFS